MYVVQMLLYIFKMLNACPVCHNMGVLVLMGIHQLMKLSVYTVSSFCM